MHSAMRNSKQTKQQQRPRPPPRVVQAPVTCGQPFVATDVEHVGTEGQRGDQSNRLGTSPSWILGTAVSRNLKKRSPSERQGQQVLSPWRAGHTEDTLLGRAAVYGVAEGPV